MQKLLETIKIVEGQPQFLAFHNQRVNTSRKILFGRHEKLDLADFIHFPPQKGIYRCRVIYSAQIEHIEYVEYCARIFKRFRLVEADSFQYDFKYLDRTVFDELSAGQGDVDDILIVKKGLVTDTSIANVAFWRENQWITPKTPLLQGTTRRRLLQEGQLVEGDITVEELKGISKMAIMNALIGFQRIDDFIVLATKNV